MTTEEFDALATEYDEASGFHSFPSGMMRSPGFHELVAGGEDVVRFILAEMEPAIQRADSMTGGHRCVGMNWILVLTTITQQDIWSGESMMSSWRAVDVLRTHEAWLEWGRANGYLDVSSRTLSR